MDSIDTGLKAAFHELDPLSAAEIVTAAAIVRTAHDLGDGMRFETIVLREPDAAGPAAARPSSRPTTL